MKKSKNRSCNTISLALGGFSEGGEMKKCSKMYLRSWILRAWGCSLNMGEKGSQERFQGFCVTFYILLIHYLRKMYPSPSKFQVLEGSLVVCLKKSSHPLMMVSTHTPFSSVQFSRSVVSDSSRPSETQHTRPPCPSPTPEVYANSCPSSRWCHPAISSSVVPFSSCPQSLPASGSFPMSQLLAWGGQSIGVSASASVLPMNTQVWSPLRWTGWISLLSKVHPINSVLILLLPSRQASQSPISLLISE